MTTQTANQTITAGYIRLTKDESLQTNLSAPAQRKGIEQYVQHAKLGELHIYEETKAIGGHVPMRERPQGSRLLADIVAGRVSAIVVRDLTRLVRDIRVAQDLVDVCRKHAVAIHTFSGIVRLSSASDRFAYNVQSAASQFEKEQVADRVTYAKQEMVEQGRWPGGPPPYSLTSQARHRSELIRAGVSKELAEAEACERYPQRHALYIDEQEAEVLRLIYKLSLSGHGSRRIIGELNKQGIRTRAGGFWSTERLSRTLANPAAAGFLVNAKGRTSKRHAQLYKANHPAVVSIEDWKKIQSIRSANYSAMKCHDRNTNRKYLLSGVIKCTCGAPMRGKSIAADRSGRYVCTKAFYYGVDALNGCNSPAHTLNMNRVHEAFWTTLLATFNDGLTEKLYEATQRHLNKAKDQTLKSRQLAEQIAKIEGQVALWYTRHDEAEASSAKEAAWARIITLTDHRKELARQLDIAQAPIKAVRFAKADIDKYLASITSLLQTHSPDEQTALVRSLIDQHGLTLEMIGDERMRLSMKIATPGVSKPVEVDQIVFIPRDKTGAWMREQTNPACLECGKPIKLLRRHFWLGKPKYHHKCWSRKLGRDRFKRSDDLITGGEVARLLGIGRSSVTRRVRAGKLSPVDRGRGVLWFRRTDVI